MKRDIFEKIADFINGNHKKETSTFNNIDNGIDRKECLIESIIMYLKGYTGIQVPFNERSLTIRIEDYLFYDLLRLNGFKEELTYRITEELGFLFGYIEISSDSENWPNETNVMQSCYLSICPLRQDHCMLRAIISSVPGCGSIIGDSVILDSRDIKDLPQARYNIGAGVRPYMSRQNQIAIDDNEHSPDYEKNKYVSRAHAHILYSDTYGFMLKVEQGGTRAAQKRTHIMRAGEKIELDNTLVSEPLKDGDNIVLSKNVYLLIKEIR